MKCSSTIFGCYGGCYEIHYNNSPDLNSCPLQENRHPWFFKQKKTTNPGLFLGGKPFDGFTHSTSIHGTKKDQGAESIIGLLGSPGWILFI